MYKCKICSKEFEKFQQVGAHVLHCHKKNNRGSFKKYLKNKNEYNKNPKFCGQCKKIIDYDVYRKDSKNIKFCSRSCAAIFNNLSREKKNKNCSYCGKIIFYSRSKKNNLYCNKKCESLNKIKKLREEWLQTGVPPNFTGGKSGNTPKSKYIKDLLIEEQNNRCAICNLEQVWNGKPIIFILDHVDGNCTNNLRSNLRLICPNCDSQTDTYKSKNRGKGRRSLGFKANKGL